MKTRIAAFAIVLALVFVSLFTQGSYAWFTDIDVKKNEFRVGEIYYIYSGSLKGSGNADGTPQVVVPGEELFTSTSLILTNHSNISTNLRLQIRYSFQDLLDPTKKTYTNEVYVPGTENALSKYITLNMATGAVGWEYKNDSFYYYRYKNVATDEAYVMPAPADLSLTSYNLSLVNSLKFNGETIDKTFSGKIFTLKLVFQAKQANFVDWVTIGTVEIDNLMTAP